MRRIALAFLLAGFCFALLAVGIASAQSTPTKTPILSPTQTPTTGSVISDTAQSATVLNDANLRSGPGTTFAVSGSAKAGDKVAVVGASPAGDWYQLDNGKWIAAFLVELSQAPGIATPLATARTATPTRTPTPRPATPTPDPVALLTAPLTANLESNNRDVTPAFEINTISQPDGLIINVRWPLNDNFTLSMIKKSAMMDAVTILRTIHESGAEFSLINLTGTFELVDSYGNASESPVLWLTISRATMDKINWSDAGFIRVVLYQHLAEIADHIKYHKALQE